MSAFASSAPRPSRTTLLAFERTRIAYERTMMAWVRTATSLITFGFAVYKFFQFELKEAPPVSALIGPRGFGLAMIVIGLLALLLGAAEHWRDLHALRRQYPGMPHSMSAWIGMAIGALGLVALLTVLARA